MPILSMGTLFSFSYVFSLQLAFQTKLLSSFVTLFAPGIPHALRHQNIWLGGSNLNDCFGIFVESLLELARECILWRQCPIGRSTVASIQEVLNVRLLVSSVTNQICCARPTLQWRVKHTKITTRRSDTILTVLCMDVCEALELSIEGWESELLSKQKGAFSVLRPEPLLWDVFQLRCLILREHFRDSTRKPLLCFSVYSSTPGALNQEPRCMLGSLLPLRLGLYTFGAWCVG